MDLFRYLGEVIALGALVTLYLVAAWNYPMLPERVPRHFDARGLPDAWGAPGSIWVLPVIALPLYALCTLPLLLAEIGRHPAPPLEAAVLAWLKAEILIIFLWIEWRSVEVAYERAAGLGAAFLPVTLVVVAATTLLLVLPGLREAAGPPARPVARRQRSFCPAKGVSRRASRMGGTATSGLTAAGFMRLRSPQPPRL
jgi:hypothetical protein